MSKIFGEIYQRGRDGQKPLGERKRYSCLEGDPGYANYLEAKAVGKELAVRLDGAPIKHVWVADEIRGFVVVVVQPLRVLDGELVSARKTGIVAVDLVNV